MAEEKTQHNYLVDSHCHLDYLKSDKYKMDINNVIAGAQKNNVRYMQTICTKISEFPDILNIAQDNDNIFCSVGVHPHEAETQDFTLQELVDFTENEKVIGIGETGLDYYYDHSDRAIQREKFIIHIKAAQETQLPLIVHTRSADDDMIAILKEQMQQDEFPFLIHCFSSTKRLCDEMLDIGGYISISGIITFKKSDELRDIVREVPLNRLLVETDSPFLAPVPFRGKVNQPAYTKDVAMKLAEVKNIDYQDVVHATTDNFLRLFIKAQHKL